MFFTEIVRCADTEDDAGPTTHPGGAALGLTRCLIYPDGFAETGYGGLKVVSGAHQWRMATLSGNEHSNGFSPQQSPPPGAEGDAFFERTWLAGKENPLTGEPLQNAHLLPCHALRKMASAFLAASR